MDKLEFYSLDAPVGAGKTEAAIRHILGQKPGSDVYWGEGDPVGGMNFVYVAPTVRLVTSVHERLKRSAPKFYPDGVPRRVAVVTHEETLVTEGGEVVHSEQGDAARNALAFIYDVHLNRGAYISLTTANFQNILPSIECPENWCVFMDELVDAVEFLPYSLGKNRERSESILADLSVVRADGSLAPTPLAKQVAEGAEHGHEYSGSRELVKRLTNTSLSVRRLEGDRPSQRGEAQTWYTCEPIPSAFARFGKVIFASAILRETLLYKLWTRQYRVTVDLR
jgi:hypothetical protein